MRLLVFILALLAGAKIWFQESEFRGGVEDAIVAAYRERAAEACRKAPAPALRADRKSGVAADWSHPSEIALAAGNRSVAVGLWQTDHPQWNARFRNPVLVLGPADPSLGVVCKFDVLTGLASLEPA